MTPSGILSTTHDRSHELFGPKSRVDRTISEERIPLRERISSPGIPSREYEVIRLGETSSQISACLIVALSPLVERQVTLRD